jgi:hypothetical protein
MQGSLPARLHGDGEMATSVLLRSLSRKEALIRATPIT